MVFLSMIVYDIVCITHVSFISLLSVHVSIYKVDRVPIADCVLGSTDLNIDSTLCDAAGSTCPMVR